VTINRRTIGVILLAAYILSIFAANWAIERFGIVPVGFGLMAPAGVFFAGLCFELRDLVQDTLGRVWVLAAIVVGALLSGLVATRSIAVASGVAFLLGELADFAIYTPMRARWWLVAMLVANPIGDIVDSAVFLWIAFGSLNFLTGQVIGKAYCTLIPVGILWCIRRYLQSRRVRVAVT
jgi:uncharacterized PurR-regulated membrane protein YhhQ (DUF165 family)